MKSTRNINAGIVTVFALALGLAGCGGGGSSNSVGIIPARSVALTVFAADSFREDYDHVWATIFKVELIASDGTASSLFADTTGKTIDIKTLRDATGARFAFLGKSDIPVGNYKGVRVTMTNSLTLFPKGATTGALTPFDDSFTRDASGNVQLNLNFQSERNESTDDNVVVDFDLANFKIVGGKVTPALKEGDKSGIGDKGRHEEEDVEGVVSELSGTSPTLTFNIGKVSVTTSASTTIFNADASPNPAIVNGSSVEVKGKINLAGNAFEAASIKIGKVEGDGDGKRSGAQGVPSNVDAAKMTFTLTAEKTKEFQPTKTTINIATSATTSFRGGSGVVLTVADFYSRLATAKKVEVEGSYDASKNTLTAKRARIDDEGGNGGGTGGGDGMGHEAEAKGTVTSPTVADGKFILNPVTEFDGFSLIGTTLPVATNSQTKFEDANGKSTTQANFFEKLTGDTKVNINGVYASGVLTAKSIKRK